MLAVVFLVTVIIAEKVILSFILYIYPNLFQDILI